MSRNRNPTGAGGDGGAEIIDQLGSQVALRNNAYEVRLQVAPRAGDASNLSKTLIAILKRYLARASEPQLRERLAEVIARLRGARS